MEYSLAVIILFYVFYFIIKLFLAGTLSLISAWAIHLYYLSIVNGRYARRKPLSTWISLVNITKKEEKTVVCVTNGKKLTKTKTVKFRGLTMLLRFMLVKSRWKQQHNLVIARHKKCHNIANVVVFHLLLLFFHGVWVFLQNARLKWAITN